MHALDHILDYEIDYAEQDRECSERWTWLSEALPWATLKEVETLTRRTDFPGIWASFPELGAFANKITKGRSRRVPCRISAGSFTVSAQVDLISGRLYITDNGRYVHADLDGYMTVRVEFNGQNRTMSATVIRGQASFSSSDVQYVIEGLGAANLLPPL